MAYTKELCTYTEKRRNKEKRNNTIRLFIDRYSKTHVRTREREGERETEGERDVQINFFVFFLKFVFFLFLQQKLKKRILRLLMKLRVMVHKLPDPQEDPHSIDKIIKSIHI